MSPAATPSLAALLPSPLPVSPQARLLLFAIRRLAAGGLDDAHAASALLMNFGLAYRRPLILLRATMAEIARIAQRRLSIAPCCCARSTADEAALLEAMTLAIDDPRAAHTRLAVTLGTHSCLGALTSAQALAAAFADLGYPLSADQ